MAEDHKNIIGWISQVNFSDIISNLIKRWYLLFLAAIIGASAGYYKAIKTKPTYMANITFVLSTEQKQGGFGNIAAQLGFDAITSNSEGIFSGENIIELFKSRMLIGSALLYEIDSKTHQTLLNLIAQIQYNKQYKNVGPLGNNPDNYSPAQNKLYRLIITDVSKSFDVFKKDKRLIVYTITATSTDPEIANYLANSLLDQTSKYFIETKTKVATSSVKLLQHEADSLGRLLRDTYTSTAATIDRTFNLNPSITVQRSGSLFNQAKAVAYGTAYTEVMRNLELAKINLQKETPLYRILDKPELPLTALKVGRIKPMALGAVLGLVMLTIILVAQNIYKQQPEN